MKRCALLDGTKYSISENGPPCEGALSPLHRGCSKSLSAISGPEPHILEISWPAYTSLPLFFFFVLVRGVSYFRCLANLIINLTCYVTRMLYFTSFFSFLPGETFYFNLLFQSQTRDQLDHEDIKNNLRSRIFLTNCLEYYKELYNYIMKSYTPSNPVFSANTQ